MSGSANDGKSEWIFSRAADVPDAAWEAWDETLNQTPALHSPFLRPDFVRLFASVQNNVSVAYRLGDTPMFFPYQSRPAGGAAAIGLSLVEGQAVVMHRPNQVDWPALMDASGWRHLEYDHIPSIQLESIEAKRGAMIGGSPWVDLSEGFEAYVAKRNTLGGSLLKQTRRKHRKLAREVGDVQLEWEADVSEAMECLIDWKRKQHVRTGVPDVFEHAWLLQLLRDTASFRGEHFRGRISILRSGSRPVAVNLGVESRGCAHMWYTAYDYELASYSPGNTLFLKLIEEMANHQFRRFDFGPGGQPYKDRFKTDDDLSGHGFVDSNWMTAVARAQGVWLYGLLRKVKRRLLTTVRA